jgi:hypothetical protein
MPEDEACSIAHNMKDVARLGKFENSGAVVT